MKSILKKTCLLAMAAMLLCGAIGCGGRSGGGTASPNSKTVTLVYEADKINYWNEIKEGYEKKYKEEGYTLNMIPVGGGQAQDKQSTMIAQRSAPDLIVGGDVHIATQNKYLLPLDELMARDDGEIDKDDFIPAIMEKLTLNNRVYYLPEFFNVSVLYYNKNIFDNYMANPDLKEEDKISYPQSDWTYDEFYRVADKLTVRNGSAISQFGCFSTNGWWGEWLIHVRQAGGEFMKDGLVALDSPEAIEGIQRYYDKMYSANRISNQNAGDDTMGDFSSKNYAMEYGGHISNWSDLRSIKNFDWDIQLLPAVKGNQSGGELSVSAYGIYKDSKSVDATWALIKYITRKRSLDEWKAYPYPPCRTSGKELLLAIPKAERRAPQNLEVVYTSLEEGYCKSLPSERYFTYVNLQIVQGYITKILEGEYTVEAGLKEATTRANNYIRQNYMS